MENHHEQYIVDESSGIKVPNDVYYAWRDGYAVGYLAGKQMNKHTFETFGSKIAEMRSQGISLRKIGDAVGVSGEWIRQLLQQHPVAFERFTESQVSKMLGLGIPKGTSSRLRNLRVEGKITPTRPGLFWLYSNEDIAKVKLLLLPRQCAICGRDVPSQNWRYCFECGYKVRKYPYPFLSPEMKRKHIARCIDWQKRNPGKVREINLRSKARRVLQLEMT